MVAGGVATSVGAMVADEGLGDWSAGDEVGEVATVGLDGCRTGFDVAVDEHAVPAIARPAHRAAADLLQREVSR
jgi:hypothetical protein